MTKFTKKMFTIQRDPDERDYNIYLGGVKINKRGFPTKKAADSFLGDYIALMNEVGKILTEKA